MSITSTVISLSSEEILGLAKPIMIETNAMIKRELIKNTLTLPWYPKKFLRLLKLETWIDVDLLKKKFSQYCSVATWYLWRSIDPEPIQY